MKSILQRLLIIVDNFLASVKVHIFSKVVSECLISFEVINKDVVTATVFNRHK